MDVQKEFSIGKLQERIIKHYEGLPENRLDSGEMNEIYDRIDRLKDWAMDARPNYNTHVPHDDDEAW